MAFITASHVRLDASGDMSRRILYNYHLHMIFVLVLFGFITMVMVVSISATLEHMLEELRFMRRLMQPKGGKAQMTIKNADGSISIIDLPNVQ